MVALQFAVLAWASLSQHRAYNTNAYDLSWFDQLAWNTAHGNWFRTSFQPYSFLGEHFEPVLLAFAGVYRLHAGAEELLLLQAGAVSLAAVPLYLGARRLFSSSGAALLVAAAYLLLPQIHRAVLFDFHPDLFVGLCLLSAFALLVHERIGWMLVALGAVFLLKEDAFLIVGGFAVFVWLRGHRRLALGLLVAAALCGFVVNGAIMPHLRQGYPGETSRYDYLRVAGHGYLYSALTHPALVWQHLAGADQRIGLAKLLATQALLPLAGPAVIAALPLSAAHLLSTHPQQQALDFHYAVAPALLLFLAALCSIERLIRLRALRRIWGGLPVPSARRSLVLAALLLAAAAAGSLFLSPLGLRYDAELYRQDAHTRAVGALLRRVPAGVAVSAQTGLLPHLSERADIHEFPDLGDARYVVVDARGRRSTQALAAGYDAVLAGLQQSGFCLAAEADGARLYVWQPGCIGSVSSR